MLMFSTTLYAIRCLRKRGSVHVVNASPKLCGSFEKCRRITCFIAGVNFGVAPGAFLRSKKFNPCELKALIAARTFLSSKPSRSEEHTSELQSQSNLVCRLL